MLTFTAYVNKSPIAVNPVQVQVVSPIQGEKATGSAIFMAHEPEPVDVIEDFETVVRQIRGALLTREVHS